MFYVVSLSRNYRVAASPPSFSLFLFRCLLSAVVQLIKRFRLLLCILVALYLSLPSSLSPASLSCIFIAVVASIRFVCHIENSFHSQFAVLSPLLFTRSLFLSCFHSVFSGSTYTNQHIKFRVASRAEGHCSQLNATKQRSLMNFSRRYKVKLIGFYKQLSNGFYSRTDLAASVSMAKVPRQLLSELLSSPARVRLAMSKESCLSLHINTL